MGEVLCINAVCCGSKRDVPECQQEDFSGYVDSPNLEVCEIGPLLLYCIIYCCGVPTQAALHVNVFLYW